MPSEFVAFSDDDAEDVLDVTDRAKREPRSRVKRPPAPRPTGLLPWWVYIYHPKPVTALHIFPIADGLQEIDVASGQQLYRGRFTIYNPDDEKWSDEDEADADPHTFKHDRCWVRGAHGEALEYGRRYLGLIQANATIDTGLAPQDQQEWDNAPQALVTVGFPDSFPALLTMKTYPEEGVAGSTKYSWTKVRDSDDPAALLWVNEPDSGDADHHPAYEVNGIDLPVPMVARLRRSALGDWYLIDMAPRWEYVRITDQSEGGATIGFVQIRDQNTHGWMDGEEVLVIDATLP